MEIQPGLINTNAFVDFILNDYDDNDNVTFPGMTNLKLIEKIFTNLYTDDPDKAKTFYRKAVIREMNKYFAMIEDKQTFFIYRNNSKCNRFGKQNFVITFSNYKILDPDYDPKKNQQINIVKFWLNEPSLKRYSGLCFTDKEPPFGYFNTFDPSLLLKIYPGDVEPILYHIRVIWCRNELLKYKYVISWLAFCVQFPFVKIGVALVLYGLQGTGKGIIIEFFKKYFGSTYFKTLRMVEALDRFNSSIEDTLFILFDEAYYARSGVQRSEMKRLITETTLSIEEKHMNPRQIESCCNIVIFTNEQKACGAEMSDRRHFPIEPDDKYSGPATEESTAYFKKILDVKPECFIDYLKNYDILGFNPRILPETDERKSQQELNLTTTEAFWFETIQISNIKSTGNKPLSCLELNTDRWIGFKMLENMNYHKSEVYDYYRKFVKKTCTQYDTLVNEIEFWKKTKSIFKNEEGLKYSRISEKGNRPYVVTLLSLKIIREEWDKRSGNKINWEQYD